MTDTIYERFRKWLRQKRCSHQGTLTEVVYGNVGPGPVVISTAQCPHCGAYTTPLRLVGMTETIRLLELAKGMEPGESVKWPTPRN